MRLRIKRGTPVFQDFKFFRWPAKEEDVDTVFDCTCKWGNYQCVAKGYGQLNSPDRSDYGNGAVFMR